MTDTALPPRNQERATTMIVKSGSIFTARTRDGFFAPDGPRPAFGMVYIIGNEWRWMIIYPPGAFPVRTDHGPRFGEMFYKHAQRLDLRGLNTLKVKIEGWLFTGSSWYVERPWPADEGSLRYHPRRQSSTMSLYLDQDTGCLTSHLRLPGIHSLQTDYDRPANGWRPEAAGTIPAAMDLFRAARAGTQA